MLQSTLSRLLTIVLGWAMVVTLTGLTPSMAAGTPPLNGTSAAAPGGDAAASLGAGPAAADPEDESGSAAEAGAALGGMSGVYLPLLPVPHSGQTPPQSVSSPVGCRSSTDSTSR